MQEQQMTPDIPELPIIRRIYDPTCAWCLGEQGIAPQDGSHGMCRRHQAHMLAQHRRVHAARQAKTGATA
jgi:hypothetical protein